MTTVMTFPRTRPQQSTSISAQQTTIQQTGGIDISTLINLMLPAMMIGMIGKMMSGMMGKPKPVKAKESETTNPKTKKAATAS
jgi:hypothetical protein